MISAGSLVRSRAHRWDMPIGGIYLVISDPYNTLTFDKTLAPVVVDILFKGEPRMIDIHNVEEIK